MASVRPTVDDIDMTSSEDEAPPPPVRTPRASRASDNVEQAPLTTPQSKPSRGTNASVAKVVIYKPYCDDGRLTATQIAQDFNAAMAQTPSRRKQEILLNMVDGHLTTTARKHKLNF
jgi:hypothetical protein